MAFAYSPAEAPVLHDIRLAIPAGSFIAITGRSGAGKTTLARLLLGLLTPTANLDTAIEAKIADEIATVSIARVAIARRPSLIERADIVLDIKDGAIEEIFDQVRGERPRTGMIWLQASCVAQTT